MMADAVALMAKRKISELPVVDRLGKPVGMIDVTDVVGMFPELGEAAPKEPARPEYRVYCEPKQGRSA